MAVVSALDDLRRHVLDGAAEGVRPPLPLLRAELAAQPEVGEHDVPLAVQQDVLQLDVAVDDAVLVQVLQREDDLPDVDAHLVLRELLALVQVREQLAAVHVV